MTTTHSGAIDQIWGNYQYLTDIANAAIAKFPGLRITSGFRLGDPHHHGRRMAIDIAFPASRNGDLKYKEVGDWIFDTFPDRVAYVIALDKVRDRNGYSGTGTSGKWVPFPGGGHMDHIHVSGEWGAENIKGGTNMPLNIVDLSNNNGSKNLKDYPADGYVFKATEGNYFVDKFCDQFVQQAIKANKLFGVYHFMDGSNWQQQADFFLKNITGYIGKGLLVLDYEMYGRQGTAIAKKWLDYVYEKTGVKPLVYTSVSVTKEENWSEVVKAGYGLWVADYTPPLDKIGYWPSVAMWQYTEKPYDKNYFYGDKKAWEAYAKSAKKVAETKPTPPKDEQEKIKLRTITINSDGVNLRSAPKVDKNNIIAKLSKGNTIEINDIELASGIIWGVQPRADGTKGYIDLGQQYSWIK